MPIGRANVQALLESVRGGGVATVEVQLYILCLRRGFWYRPTLIALKLSAHSVELIHLESPLECVEERGFSASIRSQEDNELRIGRQVLNR